MSTLFPAPLLPMTPMISPSGISNDTLFRTRVSSKSMQRSLTLMNGFGMFSSHVLWLFCGGLVLVTGFPVWSLLAQAFGAGLLAGSPSPPDNPPPFQRSGSVKIRHSIILITSQGIITHMSIKI